MTRQNHYRYLHRETGELLIEELILEYVLSRRSLHSQMGSKKLYYEAKRDLVLEGIGRDKFLKLLRDNGLLLKRRWRKARTTNSRHSFRIYGNELNETARQTRNGAVVSDITYIRLGEGFHYLSLVTEVSSRKIVGYDLSHSLGIEGSIRAMRMAIREVGDTRGMIHHSDRGIQYCSREYIKMLKTRGIRISMSEKGNPYENAIAERINGILKKEYRLDHHFGSKEEALRAVREAIRLYNDDRPHWSLGLRTPSEVYASGAKK